MTRKISHITTLTVSTIAICMAVPALAQHKTVTTSASANDSTVIVVTANKRKEKLMDVPQSINVVTGDTVQKLNLTQFDDVQKVVPGLDISRGSGRDFSVSLRGVYFDPTSSITPTVDLYLNEVPVDASTVLGGVYDIGDFQVLRGPQGTLRSGTGPSGAILLGSKQASLTSADGYYSISGTDDKNENLQFAYGVPLLDGKLAVRVAGLYDHNNGVDGRGMFYDDPDHAQTTSGRVSFTYKPTDNLVMHAMYQGLNSRSINEQFIYGTGPYGTLTTSDRIGLTKAPGLQLLKSQILTYDAAWSVAGNTLTYVGGYQKNNSDTIRDADDYNSFGPGLQEYQGLYAPSDSWTNELRFERTGDHFWIYRFGAFYGRQATANTDIIDYTGANGNCFTSPGPLAAYGLPCLNLGQKTYSKSQGLFTTQDFKFTPNDIVELGIRDSKFDNISGKYSAVTGSANYKHYFSKDLMVYVNYGTSYRPAWIDTADAEIDYMLPSKYFTMTAETSKASEIGFKSELFDRRLEITADAFYQKFKGYLYKTSGLYCTAVPNAATGPTANTVYPTNNGLPFNGTNGCTGGNNELVYLTGNADAIAQGVEFEVRDRITNSWTAQADGTWTDSHFDNAEIYCNDFNGTGQANSTGTPAVQRGQYVSVCKSNGPMSNLPKWTLAFTSNYSFPISGEWNGFARGLANIRPKATDPFDSVITPGSQLVDIFLGATSTSRQLEVSLYVKNLFNEITVIKQPINLTSNSAYGFYTATNGLRLGFQVRQSF